jgi:hypothetical protein
MNCLFNENIVFVRGKKFREKGHIGAKNFLKMIGMGGICGTFLQNERNYFWREIIHKCREIDFEGGRKIWGLGIKGFNDLNKDLKNGPGI